MAFDSLNRYVHTVIAYSSFDSSTNQEKEVYIFEAIKDYNIKQITVSNNRFSLGQFCKNSLELTYYKELLSEPITWTSKKIHLYIYEGNTLDYLSVKDTWVSVGVFYIDDSKTTTNDNGKTYTVSGYDMPSSMSDEVPSEIGTNVQTIVSNTCSANGLAFNEETPQTEFTLETIESIPEGTTYAGLLGYIAGFDGSNLRMDRDGNIEIYGNFHSGWLTPSATLTPNEKLHPGHKHKSQEEMCKGKIARSVQFLGELTLGEETPQVNAIISGTSESTVTAGSGKAIEFENPYVDKEQAQVILEKVSGLQYYTGTVKWKGDPNIQCGDIVKVETNEGIFVYFYIMEQTISYDGGMNFTSTAYSYVAEQTVIGGTSPTQKKLQVVYNSLQEAFKKSSDLFDAFTKGGYYRELYDEETNRCYGFQITDSEEITSTTKGWRFTQAGFGYTTDGFQTISKISITMDGRIVADNVTAGSIDVGALSTEVVEQIQIGIDASKKADTNATNISQVQESVKQTNTTISNAQSNINDIKTDVANIENKLNTATQLSQRITLDSNGVKIAATDDGASYVLIQNDGMRVYVNGTMVAEYLSDRANVNNVYFNEGKIGKHIINKFTVDGIEGTAFFYVG